MPSAEGDPYWFTEWFDKHRPEDSEYLNAQKNKLTHLTVDYLEKVIEELRG